jgi:lipoprotein NlpI
MAGLALGLAACATKKDANTSIPYDATLAIAAMQGRDFDEAARLWTNVLALPDLTAEQRARAYVGRSAAYLRLGKIELALGDANAAIGAKPDLPEVYVLRGGLYLEKREDTLALQDFETAIKDKPELTEAYAGRGEVYLHQGRFDLAIADFDTAIGRKPYVADFYVGRGRAAFFAGNTKPAADDFNEAIRREPNKADGYRMRGVIRFQSGQFDAAAADFVQSLSLKANQPHTVLWLHLARLHTKTADESEFAGNAAKLDLSKWPGPIVRYYQGQEKADEVFALPPGSTEKHDVEKCEASYYVAETLLAARKRDDAKRMLEAARPACPAALVETRLIAAELGNL